MLVKIKHTLIDSCLWLFWVPFRKLIRLLPIQVSCVVAVLLGWLASHTLLSLRTEIARELATILVDQSPDQLRKIAADSIQFDIQRRIEELFLSKFNSENIEQFVSIEGKQFLQEAVDNQRGTIILLSHFGSFLMILPAIAYMGYPVHQLSGPPELKQHRKIHNLIFQIKSNDFASLPFNFLHSNLHIKKMLQVIRRNELVAIAFDGRVSNSWVSVKFFNKKACFAPGPVKIASKTGCTILPTFIIRDAYNHHTLVFEKPYTPAVCETKETSIAVNTQQLAAIFEKKIRKYPNHFAMIMHINKKRAENNIIARDIFS